MPRALLSVYDKAYLLDFARELAAMGWDLVASGGTARYLQEGGLDIVPVERLTSFPELLGGRVKTLHPAIHAGILARDQEADLDALKQAGFAPIDMVVCNLYPFQAVVAEPDSSLDEAIEHIDIGGVTLLRAAAKNFQRVTAIVEPEDYERVLEELREETRVSLQTRQYLALKAFAHTRDYDTAIHAYLSRDIAAEEEALAPQLSLALHLAQPLRYGENPQQRAGFYAPMKTIQPLGGHLLAGKALSYNNILDADAAWRAAQSFGVGEAAVVIVKHLTPCGIAVGERLASAFEPALQSDPLSAYGGVIAVNQPVTGEFVQALGGLFVEVLIAPDFDAEARHLLQRTRKNCRLISMKDAPAPAALEWRSVLGGILVQERDPGAGAHSQGKVVTERAPSEAEIRALEFAWKVIPHIKSNAIVLANDHATLGIGGGLPSRLDAVKLALEKAGERARGAVLASDAFFPFADAVQAAAAAGVTAVIQPGGSIRDQEVISAANEAGISMVFTGQRHFRH